MKFIYEKQEKKKDLTLKDVQTNQFFVCKDGYLCQKANEEEYITIADNEGYPSSNYFECGKYMPIARLLPLVERIEF